MKEKVCYNTKGLEYIGRGKHGKVYKLDNEKCIKMFKRKECFQNELKTLQMAQKNKHFPRLYDWGKNMIIREYIDGVPLDQFLKSNSLTEVLSEKIINVYEALVEVGFRRKDTALLHIYILDNGELKVIDTAKAMSVERTYPKIIIKDLTDLGLKKEFLQHVKALRPTFFDLLIREK